MARCLAAAVSQAPGLRGMPSVGHCSSAATSASCARSSAMPTSRTMRVRTAMTLGDSMRQTASIARCVSVAVTATDHTIVSAQVQLRAGTAFRWSGRSRYLASAACKLLPQLHRVLHAVSHRGVRGRIDLPDLALAVARHLQEFVRQLDRVLLRARLENREAANQLLRLGERAVCDSDPVTRLPHACAKCARQASLGRDQGAFLHALLDQLLHPGDLLEAGRDSSFNGLEN